MAHSILLLPPTFPVPTHRVNLFDFAFDILMTNLRGFFPAKEVDHATASMGDPVCNRFIPDGHSQLRCGFGQALC